MSPPLRILIADDHELVRAGFRNLIENFPDLEVVAEANDGQEALGLIAHHNPDIVLMDISMPGLGGLEATRRAVKDFPQVRIIILSMHAIDEYVIQALRAGASGYLIKDSSPAELILALKTVTAGETYLSPGVSRHMLAYIQDGAKQSLLEELTDRQRQILQLIGEGCTTIEIANRYHISPKTVGAHRKNIMERLNIHDISGLMRFAIQRGLVSTDE